MQEGNSTFNVDVPHTYTINAAKFHGGLVRLEVTVKKMVDKEIRRPKTLAWEVGLFRGKWFKKLPKKKANKKINKN